MASPVPRDPTVTPEMRRFLDDLARNALTVNIFSAVMSIIGSDLAIQPQATGKIFIGTSSDSEAATYPARVQVYDEITAAKVGSSGYVAFDITILNSADGDNGAFRAAITQRNGVGDATLRAGEFHTIKETGSTNVRAWALELGLHSDVAPSSPIDGVGIYISSWHSGWTPGAGARQGAAIYVDGADGWSHGYRYIDTDGTSSLCVIDQTGAIISRSFMHPYFFTAPPAGGTAGIGLRMSSTANFGVFFGSGVPTLSAAQGSLYMRTDGSSTSTRMYVNTNGSTGWTNVTTAT
jgi:hypothetical protein